MLANPLAYRPYIQLLALLTIALGGVAILGWLFEISPAVSVLQGYNPMKFNTALCFVLLGFSVFLRAGKKSVRAHRLSAWLGIAVVVLCLLTIFQSLLNINLGIDELFIQDVMTPRHFPAGRMSGITAFCLLCIGLGLAASNTAHKATILASQYLFNSIVAVSYVLLLGYIIQVPELYTLKVLTPVSLNSALALLFLSAGASLLNPFLGITGMLTGRATASIIARRLTVQLLSLVLLSACLRLLAHQYNAFSAELGIAVFAVLFSLIAIILAWKTYKALLGIEEKKRLAEERFRSVVESAPNGMVISDKAGKITMINAAAERMFGYDHGELLGSPIERVVPQKFRSSHASLRSNFMGHSGEYHMGYGRDLYAVTKDGAEVPVEITLKPIVTDEGKMVLASIIDISERVRTAATLKAQYIELKTRYRELEQFNYIASHDLKEPLRTVSNYISIIEEDYPDQLNEEIKEYHRAMNNAVTRMNTLVHLLLDYARLGYNKQLHKVDSRRVVNEVIADLHDLITKNNATIIVKEMAELSVYETEFRLLFQNLINNAIKFRRDGVAPEIEIGSVNDGAPYEFYVRDNGIGIPQRHLGKIFNIFQRLHKETEYSGHGIGLTSCKKIVDMHGGQIWAESVPGQGSTFRFTIAQLDIIKKDEKASAVHHAD